MKVRGTYYGQEPDRYLFEHIMITLEPGEWNEYEAKFLGDIREDMGADLSCHFFEGSVSHVMLLAEQIYRHYKEVNSPRKVDGVYNGKHDPESVGKAVAKIEHSVKMFARPPYNINFSEAELTHALQLADTWVAQSIQPHIIVDIYKSVNSHIKDEAISKDKYKDPHMVTFMDKMVQIYQEFGTNPVVHSRLLYNVTQYVRQILRQDLDAKYAANHQKW